MERLLGEWSVRSSGVTHVWSRNCKPEGRCATKARGNWEFTTLFKQFYNGSETSLRQVMISNKMRRGSDPSSFLSAAFVVLPGVRVKAAKYHRTLMEVGTMARFYV